MQTIGSAVTAGIVLDVGRDSLLVKRRVYRKWMNTVAGEACRLKPLRRAIVLQ